MFFLYPQIISLELILSSLFCGLIFNVHGTRIYLELAFIINVLLISFRHIKI